MAELRFFVEFVVSMAVLVVPFVLVVRRVSAEDGVDFGDLVRPSGLPLLGPGPAEEDPAPRWRPERIRPWSLESRTGAVPLSVDPIAEPGGFVGRGEKIRPEEPTAANLATTPRCSSRCSSGLSEHRGGVQA